MTWADARTALLAALNNVDELDSVLAAPPASGAALRKGVSAMLTPPARTSDRRPSCSTRRTYRQPIAVMTPFGSDVESASTAVDNAVEAVDVEMELHVTLGGTATSCGPFVWESAIAADYPPNSGLWFVAVTGSAEIVLIVDVDRQP